jgi:hypothetical protein
MEKAVAEVPADRDTIFGLVKASIGGFPGLNRDVKGLVERAQHAFFTAAVARAVRDHRAADVGRAASYLIAAFAALLALSFFATLATNTFDNSADLIANAVITVITGIVAATLRAQSNALLASASRAHQGASAALVKNASRTPVVQPLRHDLMPMSNTVPLQYAQQHRGYAPSAPQQGYAPSAPQQGYALQQGYAPQQGHAPQQSYAPQQGNAPYQIYVPQPDYVLDPPHNQLYASAPPSNVYAHAQGTAPFAALPSQPLVQWI